MKAKQTYSLWQMAPRLGVTLVYGLTITAMAVMPARGVFAAVTSADFDLTPLVAQAPGSSNILIILDNSNSMDEDVVGNAAPVDENGFGGSASKYSRSQIARNAIKQVIYTYKDNKKMRFGLMAYDQNNPITNVTTISKRYLYNSYYYASYNPDPALYNWQAPPQAKDSSLKTKRVMNPTDPNPNGKCCSDPVFPDPQHPDPNNLDPSGNCDNSIHKYNCIYYNTALPFYDTSSAYPNQFCHSWNYTNDGLLGFCNELGQCCNPPTQYPPNQLCPVLAPGYYLVNGVNQYYGTCSLVNGCHPTIGSCDSTGSCFGNDLYSCYTKKTWTNNGVTPFWAGQPTGPGATPPTALPLNFLVPYGYAGTNIYNGVFGPTDSDIAAGFNQFGYENASVYVGPTWFSSSSNSGGRLLINIDDSTTTPTPPILPTPYDHISQFFDLDVVVWDQYGNPAPNPNIPQNDPRWEKGKLGRSQFVNAVDTPLRNAGNTPIAGTLDTALKYFSHQPVPTASDLAEGQNNPIDSTISCQKNFIVLVTDGLPSINSHGQTGTTDELLQDVKDKITALRNVTNSGQTYDVKTFVVGFALTGNPAASDALDQMATVGGTGTHYDASDEATLNSALRNIFQQISQAASSGTAAVINTNSRNGDGATFMSMFYPEVSDVDNHPISWVGRLGALFLDQNGRLREDSNGNGILDENVDRIIEFQTDSSGNNVIGYLNPVGATSEIVDLTMPDASSLATKYFLINSTKIGNAYHEYYVWFNVGSAGPPTHPPATQQPGGLPPIGIEVDLNTSDSAATVAIKTAQALNDNLWFHATVVSGVIVRVQHLPPGSVVDASNGTATTVSVNVTTQGSGQTGTISREPKDNALKYLWDSNYRLAMNDADALNQPAQYEGHNDSQRYIFTFVDAGAKMVTSTGNVEQVDFASPSDPTAADLTDPNKLFLYILAGISTPPLSTFVDPNTKTVVDLNVSSVPAALKTEFLQKQAKRIIDYIRGADQGPLTLSNGITVPAFRSRQFKRAGDASPITWRLGDIVNSNPLTVDRPRQNYNQIYGDSSYTTFATQYQNRRAVVYVGANDGMLHAFNAGFYENRLDKNQTQTGDKVMQYLRRPYVYQKDAHGYSTESLVLDPSITWTPQLGAELWAYVPFNLLPHLPWLTEPGEPSEPGSPPTLPHHVYYVDLEPTAYDVKIFTPGPDHPQGWGTILVGGMRFGGGAIDATISGSPRTMSSAYFILDITNPEKKPTVLAEINLPNQGFTTNVPALTIIKDRGDAAGTNNLWALVFGNGPVSSAGAVAPLSVGKADSAALRSGLSQLPARIFMVNLNELAQNHKLQTLNSSGTWQDYNPADPAYQVFNNDKKAYVSDIVASDFNLDYKTDALYFGTVQDMSNPPVAGVAIPTIPSLSGKLRRVVIDNNANPAQWQGDSVLIDLTTDKDSNGNLLHQPITAAPNTATDDQGNAWVYFATGRYLSLDDRDIDDHQAVYGIKEPQTGNTRNWGGVVRSNLYDSTGILISARKEDPNQQVSGTYTGSWNDFIAQVAQSKGWFIDLVDVVQNRSAERVINQPAVAGGLVAFTSFVPIDDPCGQLGESFLWGVNYLTGTASNMNVMGIDSSNNYTSRVSLGAGLNSRPTVHQTANGRTYIYAQRSDGSLFSTPIKLPGISKSGRVGWQVQQ